MEVPWIRGEAPVVLRMKREKWNKISGRGAKPVERRSAKNPTALRSDLCTERPKMGR